MEGFISWEMLGTYTGAIAMVTTLTQFTKDLGFVKNMPTQIWSFILAVIVVLLSNIFTDNLTVSVAVASIFNGVVVSLAANGSFSVFQKSFSKAGQDVQI